jgi:hypothetical protein
MSRRLVFVWLLLAALVAAIFFLDRGTHLFESEEEHAAHSGVPSGDRRLLPAPMVDLAAIEVAYGGALHRFERDAQGAWFYHAHATNPEAVANHTHVADAQVAQRIAKAFAGLENARLEREFPNDPTADFGVTAPEMFLVVYGRESGTAPLARYAMGTLAPDNFSRYVLPSGSAKVVTIANYQFDNLVALIKDMQGKPPG